MRLLFVLVLLLNLAAGQAQTAKEKDYLLTQNLPGWAWSAFTGLKLDSVLQLADFINPFYLEADFNGDHQTDIAFVATERTSGKKGIVIIHQSTGEYFILGAGRNFGNGGDNFDWMDIWNVYIDKKIEPGSGDSKAVVLKASAIYVAQSETASAVIYWTGKKYQWYQQGD